MQVKNVFYNQLEGIGIPVAERIMKQWGVENLYIVQIEEHSDQLSKSSVRKIIRETYNFMDVQTAHYDDYIWYDELPPLDKNILDAMSIYEPEILKMMDRVMTPNRSTEMRMIQYHEHVRYWNYFLDKAEIGVFIHHNVAHDIYDHVLIRLCKIKGIPTLTSDYIPITYAPSTWLFYSYEDYDPSITEKIKEFAAKGDITLSEKMEKEYQILSTQTKPRVDGGAKVKAPGGFKKQVWRFRKMWGADHKNALKKVVQHTKDRRHTNDMIKYYNSISEAPDYSKKFIYFPLHVQPEASTSPIGGWYVHQYLAVQMISYYLPDDVYIYVKEHPAMGLLALNSRVKEQYDILQKMKNVRFIDMKAKTLELTDHCIAVAAITGTAGYEGMYKHKPFLMFGEQFFKYAPCTLNIRTNEDCKKALDDILSGRFHFEDNDIRAFLKVVDDYGVKNRWWYESKNAKEAKESVDEIVGKFEAMLEKWGDYQKVNQKNQERISYSYVER